MATKKVVQKVKVQEAAPKFDAVTIVKSDRYKQYAVLLDAILEPGKEYTHEEVQALIQAELNRPIKVEINK